jgi:hypothetical protein
MATNTEGATTVMDVPRGTNELALLEITSGSASIMTARAMAVVQTLGGRHLIGVKSESVILHVLVVVVLALLLYVFGLVVVIVIDLAFFGSGESSQGAREDSKGPKG